MLIRLTIFSGEFPEHISELKWMVIGEKLTGECDLYVDIWDDVPPLSAAVYQIIDTFFGRSPLTNHLISTFLVFIQAILFNNLLLKHRAYNESTYLPGFTYILLVNLFYDFYLLSPVLLGMTFILMALNDIITHLGENRHDQLILSTGIYLGVANLFYYPAFLLIFVVFLAYTILTGTTIRRYLLLLFGYTLPLLITYVIYYLKGGLSQFNANFVLSMFNIPSTNYLDPLFYLYLTGLPLILVIIAAFNTMQSTRFTNQQERIQKLMIIYLVVIAFGWLVNRDRAPYQLMILAIPSAFFLTHYFLNINVKWKAEIVFSVFVAAILFINISTYKKAEFVRMMTDLNDLEVKPQLHRELVKGKRIVYIGNNYHIYQDAQLATPYFNWYLSQIHLNNPEYYDNLTAIHNSFKNDLPEVIIDEMKIMAPIMSKMPMIRNAYRINADETVYQLKE